MSGYNPSLSRSVTGVFPATCVGYRGPLHGKKTTFNDNRGSMRMTFDYVVDDTPEIQGLKVSQSVKYPWNIDAAPLYNGDEPIMYTKAQIAQYSLTIPTMKEAFQKQTLYGALWELGAVALDAEGTPIGVNWEGIPGARVWVKLTPGQNGGSFVEKIWNDGKVPPPPPADAVTEIRTPATAQGTVARQATVARERVAAPQSATRQQQRAPVATTLPQSMIAFKETWFPVLIEAGIERNEIAKIVTKHGAQKFAMLKLDKAIQVFWDLAELANNQITPVLKVLPQLPPDAPQWGQNGPAFVAFYTALTEPSSPSNDDAPLDQDL